MGGSVGSSGGGDRLPDQSLRFMQRASHGEVRRRAAKSIAGSSAGSFLRRPRVEDELRFGADAKVVASRSIIVAQRFR